ncbi:MAG: NifB/NifX family molybdenum-iron cluster-binding protein [Halanaerobium sp.]|nr:NifB/NifX family molybdenum-iron cluster-binding protein [Halanaerobium sp.]
MKVAVATEGNVVAGHFGRCSSYMIIELDDGSIIGREELENPGHEPGFLPGFLAEKGINCIITGGMGPKAAQLFNNYAIKTVIGASGQVDQVIEDFLSGTLETGPSMCDH